MTTPVKRMLQLPKANDISNAFNWYQIFVLSAEHLYRQNVIRTDIRAIMCVFDNYSLLQVKAFGTPNRSMVNDETTNIAKVTLRKLAEFMYWQQIFGKRILGFAFLCCSAHDDWQINDGP